jgi:HAD superfamily hydrolase (TIGR01509 family)
MNKNKLICFDMDGVLISSIAVANQIFYDVIDEQLGLETADYRKQKSLMSISMEERFDLLWKDEIKKKGITDDQINTVIKTYYDRKLAIDIPVLPYAIEAVKLVAEHFDNLALVSSNAESAIRDILNRMNLLGYFKKITGLDHVRFSKPDPEIYQQTVDFFGFSPKDCLAIEDSIPGIQSAKGAGMKVIAVTTGLDGQREIEKENPDQILNDLSELNVDLINKLIANSK